MASVQKRVSKAGVESWAVLYRHGSKQPSKTFDNEASAEAFRTMINEYGPDRALRFLAEQNELSGDALTVEQLAERWLTSKEGKVTPNILRGYRRDYENWIHPYLGHRSAAHVDEADVQEWIDDIRSAVSPTTKKPLNAKSIADRHAILHQMYKWGSTKTRKLVPHNPCKETELPKRSKTNPKGLRLPELRRLLDAGADVDVDASDMVAFMAGTGWRISESIALPKWAVDVEQLANGTTAVYVQMVQVRRRHVGIIEDAKSAASLGRRLRILGPGADVVRRRIVGLGDDDFVFTFADGRPGVDRRGPWNENSFRDIRWPRIVRAAGLEDRKPTPHWLRHTHVALCIAAGMTIAEISRRLGHDDIQTTINIYGRTIEEMSDDIAARADALFTDAPALAAARPKVLQGSRIKLRARGASPVAQGVVVLPE